MSAFLFTPVNYCYSSQTCKLGRRGVCKEDTRKLLEEERKV